MYLWIVTLVPLIGFFLTSTLLVSGFSYVSNQPATPTADGTQTSLSNNPTCTDITKVQGPVIVFGFNGSYPYTIEIDSEGQIKTYDSKRPGLLPPVPPPVPLNIGFEREKISPSAVKGLVRLATTQAFWKLPNLIGQNSKKSNSDTLARFVTINLPCTKKHVIVQNANKTSPEVRQFAEMFMLLTDLVYDEPAGYKPLQ